MSRALLRAIGAAAMCLHGVAAIGDICSAGKAQDLGGKCAVDGSGCAGEVVQFEPFVMNVSTWDKANNKAVPSGHIYSYHLNGKEDTWQMYLHGPLFHTRERPAGSDAMPPVYVFATFTNQVYRFENFSRFPARNEQPRPLKATQKVVGHALAPSTGFPVQGKQDQRLRGLLIAEGQPFWVSNIDTPLPHEVYKGGVQFLERDRNCTGIFPTNPFHKLFGQVVNTVSCHEDLGVCFFTVWKFYDDEHVIWNKGSEFAANDCLWYCILGDDWLTKTPTCTKSAIVTDEHGERICHKDGVGAVHGMTVGNTDEVDHTIFDILLVYTGKMRMDNGESSMRKVRVQAFETETSWGRARDLKVLKSEQFAEDLFVRYPASGKDVGGDHVWVDSTGKYLWVSCFREAGLGVHMLDYASGDLIYSVTGLDKLVPNQYTYTAGIHGVGTAGQKGAYLAIATSSCHNLDMCIPTIPWHWPVPESWWSTAPFVIIDLASLPMASQTTGEHVQDLRVLHV